jgi:hypothetical protein
VACIGGLWLAYFNLKRGLAAKLIAEKEKKNKNTLAILKSLTIEFFIKITSYVKIVLVIQLLQQLPLLIIWKALN